MESQTKHRDVAEKINALQRHAGEVLTLKGSKERTLGQDMCPNVAPRWCVWITSLAPSLLTLPDALLFDRLGPLVGTESIIGDSRGPIRHTWDPPAAPTCTPPSHSSPTATSTPPSEPWLAKATRAVMRCHMNMAMVRLIEGAGESLESLEADSHSVQQREIAFPDDRGKEPGEFPRLKTVVVGGRWAWASFLRAWTLRPSSCAN
ncbi:unnamed protein product [Vitrella brassicaformis CCMP3155]|uniref:Uncharacterized protein n=1 Tax=Vitrella brassicaformis (strain CCMP3155) TaxID=1169540 RepID=A0A0G4FUW9_VITBC|nr:unnamed protein product [Vitrella brassicaformis CCMP3155]|eukprot:CEM18747.1 unnamed protein product [Vitrella brassicaformis CCMP3155]